MSLLFELTDAYSKQEAARDAALKSFEGTYVQRVRQAVHALRPTVEFSTAEMVAAWKAKGFEHPDIALYIDDMFRGQGLQVKSESRQVDRNEYDTILIVSGWAK